MQERAEHTNKAAAVRAERTRVRSRSRRRVFLVSLALFGVVFALLSYRLMAGLDPSASNAVASTSVGQYESDDDHADDGDDDEDDGEDHSGSSASSGPGPAPSTRAS